MKQLKIRLQVFCKLLTSRNFILISNCYEFEESGEFGQGSTVTRRTDFNSKRDFFLMLGAIRTCYPDTNINASPKDEACFDNNGKYIGS